MIAITDSNLLRLEWLLSIELRCELRLSFYIATITALSTLSQKSATVAENGEKTATVAEFGDSRTFLRVRQCGQGFYDNIQIRTRQKIAHRLAD